MWLWLVTHIFWLVLQQKPDLVHSCWSLEKKDRRLTKPTGLTRKVVAEKPENRETYYRFLWLRIRKP